MSKCLVTGGAGLIGSHIVDQVDGGVLIPTSLPVLPVFSYNLHITAT